jgi:hypothetical protein
MPSRVEAAGLSAGAFVETVEITADPDFGEA